MSIQQGDQHGIERGDSFDHGPEVETYTSKKLRHASAQHLHETSRRFFIGPIPAGWLQSHRKSWYREKLKFRNYTSHAVTFTPDPVANYHRQNSGRNRLADSQEESSPTRTADNDGRGPTAPALLSRDGTAYASEHSRIKQQGSRESGEPSRSPAPGVSYDPGPSRGSPRNRPEIDVQGESAASTGGSDVSRGVGRGQSTNSGRGHQEQDVGEQSSANAPDNNDNNQTDLGSSESDVDSDRPLLHAKTRSKASTVSTNLAQQEPQGEEIEDEQHSDDERQTGCSDIFCSVFSACNIFGSGDDAHERQRHPDTRFSNERDDDYFPRHFRSKGLREGEIIRAQKMLVRVEETVQDQLPEDYTENDSLKLDIGRVNKFREHLVVCRRCSEDNTPFSLQMYRTHAIPAVYKPGSSKPPHYELPINRRHTGVNLYSSLDKTLVLWHPYRHGTRIFIVRSRSAAHSVEWYTFLRSALGWRRPSSLKIRVPDLDISLIFKNPFKQLEANSRPEGNGDDVPNRSSVQNRVAATEIVQGCMDILEDRTEWSDVLRKWSKFERMGLAWKRYDRLEWVYGANEEKMFGAMAMQTSHDLELRPRYHYPTTVRRQGVKDEEPPPVEGFLIRLTSQKGVQQRLNKTFFKRLYFFTQDHYLLFCRPPRALPPQPPRLHRETESEVPSSHEILNGMPLSYDIDPFPVHDGEITWLNNGNEEYIKRHDEEAYAEIQRNISNLSHADGFIDLCRVQEVRHVQRGSSPADQNIGEGPGADFESSSRDTRQDDGATREFEDDKTFELLLENGLVIRLQAYNSLTRDEWMKRLDSLISYWKNRTAADIAEAKSVKHNNLKQLNIDEEMESIMGQFARKWEVRRAEASPHLYNMCGLTECRTVKISGQLYLKPRYRSTFKRCHVILTAGKLLVFGSTLRNRTGVEIPHIHQELEMIINLRDCYIYSGLLTESDLLYRNQTFDSNHPGHRSLPRIYLKDNFTSHDEDTAISFVVWHPLQKNLFRAQDVGAQGQTQQTVRPVTTLGVQGRTMMFKARSRVEKDRWVLSISAEIDRLQEERNRDIRIVSSG